MHSAKGLAYTAIMLVFMPAAARCAEPRPADIRRLPPVQSPDVRLASFTDALPIRPAATHPDAARGHDEDQRVLTASFVQPAPNDPVAAAMQLQNSDNEVGDAFNAPPDDFGSGIVIRGVGATMKIGGYVKADFIQDFDPIGATDLFDTTTIPTRAPDDAPHENARFHARQSRLNFDTRWPSSNGNVRVFVEGDFFSEGNRFRLRHAYGEVRNVLVGQTWTTFTDVQSLPNTLDFEGSAASINLRRAQARWTQDVCENVSMAIAIEDPRIILEQSLLAFGDGRTETPDLVANLRMTPEWGQFQIAGVVRQLGFQPPGGRVIGREAGGLNFTGALFPTQGDKVYYQIVFGRGIGSFRGLPDAAPTGPNSADTLNSSAWMVGWTHDWTERLSSNFTYGEGNVDNTPFQAGDSLHKNTYFALNLIANPIEHMFVGVEYLYGTRQDKDASQGFANRLQMSFGFYLP